MNNFHRLEIVLLPTGEIGEVTCDPFPGVYRPIVPVRAGRATRRVPATDLKSLGFDHKPIVRPIVLVS